MLTLHHLNDSRSQRILWLLEELGTPYEMKRYQRNATTRLGPPSGKRRRNSPRVAVSAMVGTSVRIIRPAVRLRTQPTSRALRMVSPRRCSRQVEKE